MSVYADKTKRLQWELKVVMVSGGYQVTLTDHDLLKKLTFLAQRWAEIPIAAETALTAVNPPWVDMDKSFKNRKGLDKFKKKS